MLIFVLLLVSVLIIIQLRQWQRKYRLYAWRQAYNLNFHAKNFYFLYHDVEGFVLSAAARQSNDAPEYVYGEIVFESFIALLSLCNLTANSIFYDLGSGCGKAVLACAMVFEIEKSIGVELFANLHHCAEKQRLRLKNIASYQHKIESIAFKNNDLLQTSVEDATLIFINATSFFGDYWFNISRHLEQISPGAQVITTSKRLKSSQFILKRVVPVQMSWGIVNAYIQQRKSDYSVSR